MKTYRNYPYSDLFKKILFELIDYLHIMYHYDPDCYGKRHLKKLINKIKVRRKYINSYLKLNHNLMRYLNNKYKRYKFRSPGDDSLIYKLIEKEYPKYQFAYSNIFDENFFPIRKIDIFDEKVSKDCLPNYDFCVNMKIKKKSMPSDIGYYSKKRMELRIASREKRMQENKLENDI